MKNKQYKLEDLVNAKEFAEKMKKEKLIFFSKAEMQEIVDDFRRKRIEREYEKLKLIKEIVKVSNRIKMLIRT